MKRSDFNPRFDQKWAWPQKTWLQQRLKAIKARARGADQKPGDISDNPAQAQGKPGSENRTEKD